MEATKFSSSKLALRPISSVKPCPRRNTVVALDRRNKGRDYGGKLVDESMIVLRLRIKETKMSEESNNPPSHWMEWEKQYFMHCNYNNDVCEAVQMLQNYLMNVRPSLALGMVLLVSLSVAISTGVVLLQAMEMAMGVLSALH
ncbi:uncharacterized protein LOC133700093 [Populus nigra]|uniref:uncharacterized protein LOC133700093 n=1 Tax=Populus nigra TaxID=3691 RepID=UPI002B266655|nr:uncharacterized protein LOC133700093 [Populus nigra]